MFLLLVSFSSISSNVSTSLFFPVILGFDVLWAWKYLIGLCDPFSIGFPARYARGVWGASRNALLHSTSSTALVHPRKACTTVGCLYLRVLGECGWQSTSNCAAQSCDTCFLDSDDWVLKTWTAQLGDFTTCVWLFPPNEAAWLVRQEMKQLKVDGRLPDNFSIEVALPPIEVVPDSTLSTTSSVTTTTRTTVIVATQTSTVSIGATSTSTSSTTLALVVQPVPSGAQELSANKDAACSLLINDWCVKEAGSAAPLTVAPSALQASCEDRWTWPLTENPTQFK